MKWKKVFYRGIDTVPDVGVGVHLLVRNGDYPDEAKRNWTVSEAVIGISRRKFICDRALVVIHK